jgi:hypothetical protein
MVEFHGDSSSKGGARDPVQGVYPCFDGRKSPPQAGKQELFDVVRALDLRPEGREVGTRGSTHALARPHAPKQKSTSRGDRVLSTPVAHAGPSETQGRQFAERGVHCARTRAPRALGAACDCFG